MRSALLGLAFLASTALAQPSAFDFVDLENSHAGVVESVREVPAARDMHAFDPETLEHTLQRPETVDEVVIRLDNGYAVTLRGAGDQPALRPGQRVCVTFTSSGPLVDPN